MSRIVVAALAVVWWMGCGGADEIRHPNSSEAAEPARDTYALGTALTPNGAVLHNSVGETFTRGGQVYLSINVSGASTGQSIEVAWIGPDETLIRRDAAEIPEGSQYAAFSSGETEAWTPGQHRAVIVINGRKVGERPFAVI